MENPFSTTLTYSESSVETNSILDSEVAAMAESDREASSEQNSTRDHATSGVPVLRRAAMDFLARREHSYQELTRKLQLKFPDVTPDKIAEVLDALRSEKLQSDDRFAESWVRYRQNRGFGYMHILADLKERGVSSQTINRYLFADDDTWHQSVENLIKKRLNDGETLEFGSKSHQKLTRYLQSRGFAPQEIQRALRIRIA